MRITAYENYYVMWGSSLEIQFMVDGGRTPYLIEVTHPNHETFIKYYKGNDTHCQNHGVNWKECKKTIDVIDYSHEGRYEVETINHNQNYIKYINEVEIELKMICRT